MAFGNSATGWRQTWQRVLAGDVTAFQSVVEKHQSAVSAVAYSILGDFSTSQDVAQETFWIAWTRRNSLRDANRLGSWLCGIARNLARQARRQLRRMKTTGPDVSPLDPVDPTAGPDQKTATAEEQQMVWDALEQIPEKYREAVTLYYRQGQSIAEVAESTGISEDAARQRLGRGRNMLRGRVARLIEGVLESSTPDASFTARVMAGIAGVGMAGKTAGAASASAVSIKSATAAAGSVASVAKGVVASGAAAGIVGGTAGSAGGLLGGWLGIWLPAQLAPTETERQLVLERGRAIMRASLLFALAVFALAMLFVWLRFHWVWYLIALLTMILGHSLFVLYQTLQTVGLVRELRKRVTPESDPNQSALKARIDSRQGDPDGPTDRCWTSNARLLGLPLVDIQMSHPLRSCDVVGHRPRIARGWIAVGDRAYGVLIAAGGMASGLVAVGGVCFGAVALGGICAGLLSFGGLALGLIAVGGVGVGWDAVGGLAVGWHSAAGGLAVAWHAAIGGAAIAHGYAVGGAAMAAESNTALARQVIEQDSLKWVMDWIADHSTLVAIGAILVSVPPVLLFRWIGKRVSQANSNPKGDAANKKGDAGKSG